MELLQKKSHYFSHLNIILSNIQLPILDHIEFNLRESKYIQEMKINPVNFVKNFVTESSLSKAYIKIFNKCKELIENFPFIILEDVCEKKSIFESQTDESQFEHIVGNYNLFLEVLFTLWSANNVVFGENIDLIMHLCEEIYGVSLEECYTLFYSKFVGIVLDSDFVTLQKKISLKNIFLIRNSLLKLLETIDDDGKIKELEDFLLKFLEFVYILESQKSREREFKFIENIFDDIISLTDQYSDIASRFFLSVYTNNTNLFFFCFFKIARTQRYSDFIELIVSQIEDSELIQKIETIDNINPVDKLFFLYKIFEVAKTKSNEELREQIISYTFSLIKSISNVDIQNRLLIFGANSEETLCGIILPISQSTFPIVCELLAATNVFSLFKEKIYIEIEKYFENHSIGEILAVLDYFSLLDSEVKLKCFLIMSKKIGLRELKKVFDIIISDEGSTINLEHIILNVMSIISSKENENIRYFLSGEFSEYFCKKINEPDFTLNSEITLFLCFVIKNNLADTEFTEKIFFALSKNESNLDDLTKILIASNNQNIISSTQIDIVLKILIDIAKNNSENTETIIKNVNFILENLKTSYVEASEECLSNILKLLPELLSFFKKNDHFKKSISDLFNILCILSPKIQILSTSDVKFIREFIILYSNLNDFHDIDIYSLIQKMYTLNPDCLIELIFKFYSSRDYGFAIHIFSAIQAEINPEHIFSIVGNLIKFIKENSGEPDSNEIAILIIFLNHISTHCSNYTDLVNSVSLSMSYDSRFSEPLNSFIEKNLNLPNYDSYLAFLLSEIEKLDLKIISEKNFTMIMQKLLQKNEIDSLVNFFSYLVNYSIDNPDSPIAYILGNLSANLFSMLKLEELNYENLSRILSIFIMIEKQDTPSLQQKMFPYSLAVLQYFMRKDISFNYLTLRSLYFVCYEQFGYPKEFPSFEDIIDSIGYSIDSFADFREKRNLGEEDSKSRSIEIFNEEFSSVPRNKSDESNSLVETIIRCVTVNLISNPSSEIISHVDSIDLANKTNALCEYIACLLKSHDCLKSFILKSPVINNPNFLRELLRISVSYETIIVFLNKTNCLEFDTMFEAIDNCDFSYYEKQQFAKIIIKKFEQNSSKIKSIEFANQLPNLTNLRFDEKEIIDIMQSIRYLYEFDMYTKEIWNSKFSEIFNRMISSWYNGSEIVDFVDKTISYFFLENPNQCKQLYDFISNCLDTASRSDLTISDAIARLLYSKYPDLWSIIWIDNLANLEKNNSLMKYIPKLDLISKPTFNSTEQIRNSISYLLSKKDSDSHATFRAICALLKQLSINGEELGPSINVILGNLQSNYKTPKLTYLNFVDVITEGDLIKSLDDKSLKKIFKTIVSNKASSDLPAKNLNEIIRILNDELVSRGIKILDITSLQAFEDIQQKQIEMAKVFTSCCSDLHESKINDIVQLFLTISDLGFKFPISIFERYILDLENYPNSAKIIFFDKLCCPRFLKNLSDEARPSVLKSICYNQFISDDTVLEFIKSAPIHLEESDVSQIFLERNIVLQNREKRQTINFSIAEKFIKNKIISNSLQNCTVSEEFLKILCNKDFNCEMFYEIYSQTDWRSTLSNSINSQTCDLFQAKTLQSFSGTYVARSITEDNIDILISMMIFFGPTFFDKTIEKARILGPDSIFYNGILQRSDYIEQKLRDDNRFTNEPEGFVATYLRYGPEHNRVTLFFVCILTVIATGWDLILQIIRSIFSRGTQEVGVARVVANEL
ncbi:MAG: hypothetical protein LBJ93_00980 [Clostridiales bacterium]|jgi:hypothetical protein|nr:hypothetical protein [Clostridiales bacterium]